MEIDIKENTMESSDQRNQSDIEESKTITEPTPTNEASSKIIWIASYPKSGNTWTRVFIHNLTREISGETEGSQNINAINKLTRGDHAAKNFVQRLGKPVHEASIAEIAAVRSLVQTDLVEGREGPSYIKTHNAIAQIEGHQTINFSVTLGAVYLVRNPLDVAISYAHHSAFPIDKIIKIMGDAAAGSGGTQGNVHDFMGSWSFHVASWMSVPHRPVLVLRYEDMLANPHRAFGRLASFLRFKPTPEQLQRAIQKSSFDELASQEATSGFVEKPPKAEKFFRVGKAEQWKDILSKSQVRAIVDAHAPMMMRCGYLQEECGAR